MKVGSLFSGIGGFDLGLERAGFQTAWFCEQDEFCQRVLRKHWPDVPIYDDITTLRGQDVEPVEALCGGFPCQDLSYAGRGAGIEGERSGLWSEYARLIGELRPRYVFVENVPALLTRGLGRVLGDLAALGYDAEWDCIPASAVGAPHRRDRIWIVAYPGSAADADSRRLARNKPDAENGRSIPPKKSQRVIYGSDGGDAVPARGERQPMADPMRARRQAWVSAPGHREKGNAEISINQGDRFVRWKESDQWATEPDVGRVADGVPARVDRLRALGNALVPQVAEWIGCRVQEWEEGR